MKKVFILENNILYTIYIYIIFIIKYLSMENVIIDLN